MTLAATADAACTRDALAAAHRLTDPTKETPVTTDQTDPHPEPESVTVTLPERILGRPWTVVELRMLAEWADNAGSGEAGAVLGYVADALDAASATQKADQAAARPAIEREAKAASVRASVLQGHLDALRKVLFEDAATDHDMRLRKAHAVIRQVEKMEPFENAYASLRAERDALAARLAAVEREAKAAALREAADHIDLQMAYAERAAGAWLREEAHRIEREGQS